MTDPENHQSIEYRQIDHRLQAGFAVEQAQGGHLVEVRGICPGCGGRTTMVWEQGIPYGYKGLLTLNKSDASTPVGPRTVYCDCGFVHPNRPSETWDNGCGSYWQVELP